jgi:hypothetical protein
MSVTDAEGENLPHDTNGLQRVRRFRFDALWLVSIHERPISRSRWTCHSELEQVRCRKQATNRSQSGLHHP